MTNHNWDPRLVDLDDEDDGGTPAASTAEVNETLGDYVPGANQREEGPRAGDVPQEGVQSRRSLVVAVAVLTLIVAVGAWALFLRPSGLPDDVAVAVDGHHVTVDELESYADVMRALFGVERPETASAKEEFDRDMAASRALAIVVDQAAEERDVTVTEDQVQQALDDFVAQRYPEGGRDAFVQALGTRGISEAQVRAEIRRQMTSVELFDRVVGDVTVSNGELRDAYEQLGDQLRLAERRTIRHLVVATEEQAQQARDRIEQGEDFADIAAEVSLDGSTRDKAGQLGTLARDELTTSFGDAAFAVGTGELFGPVQTDLGWHVGRVDAVEPARTQALEEVEDALRRRLELDEALGRWRPWLTERFAEADIRYADRFRPENPEHLPGDDVVPLVPDVPGPSSEAPPSPSSP